MPGSDRPSRDGFRRPDRGDRPERGDGERRAVVGRHVDEPELPDAVKPNDLDKGARGELRTLSKENADAVARHLVMAGRLVEEDPAEAHRHAQAAARRAGRVAVVRESLAITAYATGDFALALRELRTFRRISGSDDQIGLMVDSERGVGRPDRALELGRSVDRATLPAEAQVALAIAMSGARLDLSDPRGALDELERAPLDLQRVLPWSATLYESLAAVHEDLGDAEEADRWRRRAERAEELLEQVDEEGSTVDVSTEDDPDHPASPADAVDGSGSDVVEAPADGADQPPASPSDASVPAVTPNAAVGAAPGPLDPQPAADLAEDAPPVDDASDRAAGSGGSNAPPGAGGDAGPDPDGEADVDADADTGAGAATDSEARSASSAAARADGD